MKEIDKLSEQQGDILLDVTFCDDRQNKAFVENLGAAPGLILSICWVYVLATILDG